MNIMRKIFLTFLLVAFASAAFAEGTPKKPSVAGFVSNGFWDNWEISAGFGTGTAFSNGGNSGSWGDRFGFEGNLSVTKWVHPVFGMRAQLQGGWFNNFDSQIGKMTWPYMFGHLDFMVNASNWIGGYRADRAWYAVPFAGFGYMASNFTDRSQRENASGSRQEFAFTAGLLSKFRLSPAFDFNIELKGLLTKSGICPAEMNGSYLAGLSATVGITYRFNQRGWERGVPGYTADDIRAFQNAVAAGNSALEAARSENADLANRLKAAEAEADLRKLMHIPDNYKVLFIQGGGTVQFAMVAMNLMKNGKACYVETGAWSKKAIAEAKKFGEVDIIASSKDKNFSYIPDCSDLDIPDDCDYVYICENETINGTTWNKLPNTKGHVLVSDQSSMFLSRPCNVSDYGLIWAGVQKNVGPAGMAVVIIREDLIRDDLDPKTPIYMMYKTHADNGSMYNTPNCWAIYCCGKVFKYLLNMGGLEEMEKRNIEKAKVLYDFLDSSKLFKGAVVPQDRSLMNVPFVTGDKGLDAAVVAASKEAGFDNLKGHKSVGGLRASIYNAMPKEGVEALVEFLTKFEAEHQA